MDALLDALDHLGTHIRLRVNGAQMIRGATDNFGAVLSLGVPGATGNETLKLLHRNLLLLNKEEMVRGGDGSFSP